MRTIPFWKIAATAGGVGLTASAVWLNAEHVAASEGWRSPLVLAGIIVTLCAASAPPLAERAGKDGQPLKAVMLWIFFGLAVAFSLSASIARSSGYVAGKIAAAEQSNSAATSSWRSALRRAAAKRRSLRPSSQPSRSSLRPRRPQARCRPSQGPPRSRRRPAPRHIICNACSATSRHWRLRLQMARYPFMPQASQRGFASRRRRSRNGRRSKPIPCLRSQRPEYLEPRPGNRSGASWNARYLSGSYSEPNL
jgi:hypothetical protein